MNHQNPPPRYKKPMPWCGVLLIVLGSLLALGVLAIIAFLGFVAFACSKR